MRKSWRFAPDDDPEFSKLWSSMTQTNRDEVMDLAWRGKCNARQVYLDAERYGVSRVTALFRPAANDEKEKAAAKKIRERRERNWLRWARAHLKRAFRGKTDRATRREYNAMLREPLANCKLAYVKYHHDEALDEAVQLCGEGNVQPWMREPLIERGRAAILGTSKGKPGRRSDWMQDDIWFEMIQDRRDGGMLMKKALDQTLAELRYCGSFIKHKTKKERAFYYPKEDAVKTAYYRHQKKVKRGYVRDLGRCWVPRASVYLPTFPKKVF